MSNIRSIWEDAPCAFEKWLSILQMSELHFQSCATSEISGRYSRYMVTILCKSLRKRASQETMKILTHTYGVTFCKSPFFGVSDGESPKHQGSSDLQSLFPPSRTTVVI